MGIKNNQDFQAIYQSYLSWFRERAAECALPKTEEELLGFQIFHEDIFEDSNILLNRMYFAIPLSPSQNRSGSLETFAFSELNLMLKIRHSGIDEITNILPVEYRLE